MPTVRIELPAHLRTLANAPRDVSLALADEVTQRTILDALEDRYPMLKGTIRDQTTKLRRPFIRFFACEQDLSHSDLDAQLPVEIASGKEPFLIVGAIAGG